jgi:hypothetical protein
MSVPMADANQEKKVKLEREFHLIPVSIFRFPNQPRIILAECDKAQIKSVDMVRQQHLRSLRLDWIDDTFV